MTPSPCSHGGDVCSARAVRTSGARRPFAVALAGPLLAASLLIPAPGALAQTTTTSSAPARERVRVDVVPQFAANASSEPPPDPLSYCYYADKSYSLGARLNGQVCVRSKDEPGVVSSAPAPLRWVSAEQAARGRY